MKIKLLVLALPLLVATSQAAAYTVVEGSPYDKCLDKIDPTAATVLVKIAKCMILKSNKTKSKK